MCNFLITSLPDSASTCASNEGGTTGTGVAVAVGRMQQWPRVHEFVHSRARFLKAENVTKCSDDGAQPHVFLSRAPSRKRKRSPSDPVIYTEFVLKKVNLSSDEAIAHVRTFAIVLFFHLSHKSRDGSQELPCRWLRPVEFRAMFSPVLVPRIRWVLVRCVFTALDSIASYFHI